MFDSKIKSFVSSSILEENINQSFDQAISLIKSDDPFKNISITELKNKKQEEMDAVDYLRKREKKRKKGLLRIILKIEKLLFLQIEKLKQ